MSIRRSFTSPCWEHVRHLVVGQLDILVGTECRSSIACAIPNSTVTAIYVSVLKSLPATVQTYPVSRGNVGLPTARTTDSQAVPARQALADGRGPGATLHAPSAPRGRLKGVELRGECHEQHHLDCGSRGYRSVRTRLFRIPVAAFVVGGEHGHRGPVTFGRAQAKNRLRLTAGTKKRLGLKGAQLAKRHCCGRPLRPRTLPYRICICCGAA